MPLSAYSEPLRQAIEAVEQWEAQWPAFTTDDTLQVNPATLQSALTELTTRLQDNYPFFHPQYAGQMLKPPHPVAMLGYLTAMMINPNNHALDGGPATAEMEKACVTQLAELFGFPQHLGHLTSSGTIANLEALWVARQLHPERYIVYSRQAHYTHSRMCDLIQAKHLSIPATATGIMDIEALESTLQQIPVGTVVVTLGTTSLGAFDPLADILALQKTYGFRIHIDSAYGGFYAVLKDADPQFAPYRLIAQCDSIVVDPHKHGLQPYGCGCILFKDPEVGKLYLHDSPYTYFTSKDLHLGEISLECSRPGASAAAFWLTLQCFPLKAETGFGPILQKTRQAALAFTQRLAQSPRFEVYLPPALDIVTYYPKASTTADITAQTEAIFSQAMLAQETPIYTAKLRVSTEAFTALHPAIKADTPDVTLFRSCLMKPEQLAWVDQLLSALEHHAHPLPPSRSHPANIH